MLQSDQEQEKNFSLFGVVCKRCFRKLEKPSKALDETDEKLTDAVRLQYSGNIYGIQNLQDYCYNHASFTFPRLEISQNRTIWLGATA